MGSSPEMGSAGGGEAVAGGAVTVTAGGGYLGFIPRQITRSGTRIELFTYKRDEFTILRVGGRERAPNILKWREYP